MTKAEYAQYEAAVAEFFAREGIQNLSSGYPECPECKVEWGDDGKCPECNADRDCTNEPFFSWRSCECCGDRFGGNREHATGWNPETKEICEYTVCEDCVYYAEYGQLDDTTMMGLTARQ